ncbi:DeoR/GlpR family DNA-binding transcription regulator [Sporosarcina sp. CAU 1771]
MNLPKDDRMKAVTKHVLDSGKVTVAKLASTLGVTPETIRRDLSELEQIEVITRIHGGAIPFVPNAKEMVFQRKLEVNKDAKIAIAVQAAKRIENGDYIAIDIGTTTVHIADAIEDVHDVTVITNSLAATERFNLALEEKRMTGKVIMLGGISNPEQFAVSGVFTLNMLGDMKIDKVFLSCGGLTEKGIYDYDLDESLISSKMIEQSSEKILLVDSTKVGETSYFSICPTEEVNEIISERSCPIEWETIMRKNEVVWTTVE